MIAPSARSRRIVDDILAEIRAGRLQPGDQLPSGRELREQYSCSVTVYRDAIGELKRQRLVVGEPGRGVFVAESATQVPGVDVVLQRELWQQLLEVVREEIRAGFTHLGEVLASRCPQLPE